ncbi:MAG: hypothetical protein P8079_03895 [Gammaproteobacteria bacterium]
MINTRKKSTSSIYESFSDLALMALGTFVFLFVTIVVTSKLTEMSEIPKLKEQIAKLEKQLETAQADKKRLKSDMNKILVTDPGSQEKMILAAVGVGRKDFDVFIKGLKDIPGRNLHLVVDATGSMHGVSGFLVPILRLISTRSGKKISALTWFSDDNMQTYTGTMGDMFDRFMQGAPFTGANEYIGRAFRAAENNAPRPGAYLLLGDEPSDDTIRYSDIPSPVFALPLGRSDPDTEWDYSKIAKKTGGEMLHLYLK